MCRYAEQYHCVCDFVVCQDCYDKNNNSRSRQCNTAHVQKPQVLFYWLLNEQTSEAQCVGNWVEYHKLQYLKISDSAHIWIPSWQNKKQKELQNEKR